MNGESVCRAILIGMAAFAALLALANKRGRKDK